MYIRKTKWSKDAIGLETRFTEKNALSDLQLVKKVLDNLDIPFFLEYGTVLGIIRENDFMAWERDIDIGILDCPKRELILDRLDEHGFYYRKGKNIYDICVNRKIVWDIRLYRRGTGKLIDYYIDAYGHFSFHKKFTDFIEIEFKGFKFNIPKLYIDYLDWNFGSNKGPAPGWRVPNSGQFSFCGYHPTKFDSNGPRSRNTWRRNSKKIADEWYMNYQKKLNIWRIFFNNYWLNKKD